MFASTKKLIPLYEKHKRLQDYRRYLEQQSDEAMEQQEGPGEDGRQGHVPKDDGFAWWFLPPGLRSSTATSYEGFDESCRLVMDAFATKKRVKDILMGFLFKIIWDYL